MDTDHTRGIVCIVWKDTGCTWGNRCTVGMGTDCTWGKARTVCRDRLCLRESLHHLYGYRLYWRQHMHHLYGYSPYLMLYGYWLFLRQPYNPFGWIQTILEATCAPFIWIWTIHEAVWIQTVLDAGVMACWGHCLVCLPFVWIQTSPWGKCCGPPGSILCFIDTDCYLRQLLWPVLFFAAQMNIFHRFLLQTTAMAGLILCCTNMLFPKIPTWDSFHGLFYSLLHKWAVSTDSYLRQHLWPV